MYGGRCDLRGQRRGPHEVVGFYAAESGSLLLDVGEEEHRGRHHLRSHIKTIVEFLNLREKLVRPFDNNIFICSTTDNPNNWK